MTAQVGRTAVASWMRVTSLQADGLQDCGLSLQDYHLSCPACQRVRAGGVTEAIRPGGRSARQARVGYGLDSTLLAARRADIHCACGVVPCQCSCSMIVHCDVSVRACVSVCVTVVVTVAGAMCGCANVCVEIASGAYGCACAAGRFGHASWQCQPSTGCVCVCLRRGFVSVYVRFCVVWFSGSVYTAETDSVYVCMYSACCCRFVAVASCVRMCIDVGVCVCVYAVWEWQYVGSGVGMSETVCLQCCAVQEQMQHSSALQCACRRLCVREAVCVFVCVYACMQGSTTKYNGGYPG